MKGGGSRRTGDEPAAGVRLYKLEDTHDEMEQKEDDETTPEINSTGKAESQPFTSSKGS